MKMGQLMRASPVELVGLFMGTQERSATGNRTRRPRRDGVPNDSPVPVEHRRVAAGRRLAGAADNNRGEAGAVDYWR
jgi:hypothetical protein